MVVAPIELEIDLARTRISCAEFDSVGVTFVQVLALVSSVGFAKTAPDGPKLSHESRLSKSRFNY